MAVIVLVVMVLLVFMLIKYRASKQSDDYEPPHIEGNQWLLKQFGLGFQLLIVAFLSVVIC